MLSNIPQNGFGIGAHTATVDLVRGPNWARDFMRRIENARKQARSKNNLYIPYQGEHVEQSSASVREVREPARAKVSNRESLNRF
jgi:hypothetical protein